MKHIHTFDSFLNEAVNNGSFGDKNQFTWIYDKPSKNLTLQEQGHKSKTGFKELVIKKIEDREVKKLIDEIQYEDYLSWNIIKSIVKKYHPEFQVINESKIPDMSNVPLGAVTSYGEEVGKWELGETGRGISKVSTLRLHQAEQIADALNKGGFEAEAIQLKGQYYDGYVEVKTPRTYNDIKKMAGIIEDNLGHWLVNSKDERIRDKGRI